MGCGSCSSGGCGSPAGCGNNGSCGTCGVGKLDVFNWLAGMELPYGQQSFDIIEVHFKNTTKGFFRNTTGLDFNKGEAVVIEAGSGYDIGIVDLTGELVRFQMKKKGLSSGKDVKAVLRKPTQEDLDLWHQMREKERETMLRARLIAKEHKLNMKISDVEYQADGTKATFYYTADERVDFRSLIRALADQFKVRVEMRQIGSRQEAGRLGGIGSCGRELCCSTWLTDFRSVSTGAARYQQLSINPLKLAGQCGKLKCCLNYELDSYMDALKDFPDANTRLETGKGRAFHVKSDIFKELMWFNYADDPGKFVCLHIDRVKEIKEMNKRGEKPADLKDFEEVLEPVTEREPDIENVVGQDSLTRFDQDFKKRRKKGNRKGPDNRKKQARPQNKRSKPADNKEGGDHRKKGNRPPRNAKQSNNRRGKRPGNPQANNNASKGKQDS
jgi:cell fate regulator YaaT (PSP1 superfamily)